MYLIITRNKSDEPVPMDGEFYTKRDLWRALGSADASDRVAEFDLSEFLRDGNTSFRDVTEDMVSEGLRQWAIEPSAPIAGGFVRRVA